MFSKRSVLFQLTVLLCVISVQNVTSKRFGGGSRHSYPKSGGLSGSSSHGYPSSGGLSGNNRGGSHGYPSSGGLSGSSGSHGYPSNSQSGSHSYPSNTQSGSHGYPSSGGLSGNSGSYGSKPAQTVHHHYHYAPPQQIRYTPPHGPPMTYPVYHGSPPTYVYQAQNSGSKYGTLLAGLALLNLGALAGTAYAASHTSYKPKPGESCRFGVKKDNGDYEENKIDCQLITHFIFEAEAKNNSGTNTTTIITTVTNTTVVNGTNVVPTTVMPSDSYTVLPNGTLLPLNVTNNVTANATTPEMSSTISTVTTTVTNTTVVNALEVKGKPVDVTPGMQCYMIRITPSSTMKKTVPCEVLQKYAVQSLKKNSAGKSVFSLAMLAVIFAGMVA